MLVNLRVAMSMHFHHWFFQVRVPAFVLIAALVCCCDVRVCVQLAVAMSIISWIPAAFIFDAFGANGITGGVQRVFGSASFWVCGL